MEIVVDIVMLVLGVVLFIVGLLVIRSLLRKNKSPLPACALLALAVCMIGFSAMTSFKIPGLIEVDKAAELVQHFASAPNDPNAVADLGKELDEHLSPTNTTKLSASARLQLDKTVSALAQRTNLTVESRITLAKSQLILGRTNAAAKTLDSVTRTEPRRLMDPKIRALIDRVH